MIAGTPLDSAGVISVSPAFHTHQPRMNEAVVGLNKLPAPSLELAETCRHGDYKRVRALLVAGVDVHAAATCGGFAPLTIAAIHGHAECVRALLEAGVDAGLATGGGVTALMYAAYDGHVDCVRALIEGGANVATADGADFTAVIYAAMQEGHAECRVHSSSCAR